MKLSFSTLGCPDWTLNEIIAIASDLGYDGVEIRGVGDEIYAPKSPEFSIKNIEPLKAKLADANIEIPVFTSGAYLVDNPSLNSAESEVKDYVFLASKMGVKYVRIMGEQTPVPVCTRPDNNTLSESIISLCKFAAAFNVSLLIETNGFLADSAIMKPFIEMIDQPNLGVLWDVNHTVRYFNEDPAYTVKMLGPHIKHVHLKDSVRGTNGIITYMLAGYGTLPIKEAVSALKEIGYEGYISFEWVKRWSKGLAEPAIAFHQFINYMKDLIQ
ncbi:MAG: sugar phosphate isomerase/epimerase [Clostridiales bacterium]|nr:sugar phosphate isomerase/epimerase [Clostridiales bacterium]